MKLMVIDSQGDAIPQEYHDLLDNVTLRGIDPSGDKITCHPHGLQVGYWASVLLEDAEVVFVRIFDADAKPVSGATDWLLEVIERERPDYINRSWGMAQPDTPYGRMIGQVVYGDWVKEYTRLQDDIGFVDFAAAGNSGDWLPDNDVNYPHRLMPQTNVIGSSDRRGVASSFSSDGPEVQCVCTGENVLLYNGKLWAIGSGTSFAAPKMCGLAAAHRLDHDEWDSFCSQYGTKPVEYEDKASNKWGRHGNMSDRFQHDLAQVPKRRLPPFMQAAQDEFMPAYHDFERIHLHDDDSYA